MVILSVLQLFSHVLKNAQICHKPLIKISQNLAERKFRKNVKCLLKKISEISQRKPLTFQNETRK